ncbi:MAG TPA: response regulator transcription factor [Ohtaekwangia sp.]|nr:response regulator transcription factor [Ohtaekwangia sp.]
MNRKRSFLLVDDEALIREGLKSLLQTESFVKNIYEAASKSGVEEQLENQIDIVLLDFRLGEVNGIDLIPVINKKDDGIKIIVITGLEGAELIINLLRAGVHGIVHKLDGYKEIRNAILHVMEGDTYYPPGIIQIIQTNAHRWDKMPSVMLTLPERDLLKAIASGLTTKEIAVKLKMSEATAETYRLRLIKKVNVPNTAALLAFAYRNGML